MSCIYKVETDDFGTYDVLENDATGTRLKIRRLGAEPVSLARHGADGEWTGFLYRDGETGPPASGWGNHATVMGYYLHRLLGEKSSYRGTEIRGGNHGFLRHFEFEAPTFDPNVNALTYHVSPQNIPASAYPLRVSLDLVYELLPDGVRVDFVFTNQEPELSAHVSFGLHPGFAVSNVEACEILFPAGNYLRHWAPGNFLDGRVESVEHAGGPMPFDKSALPDSYLLGLSQVASRLFTMRDGERAVVLNFSDAPYCTLWSDNPGLICIEPCWGLPDSDPQKPFEDKDGIQVIAPQGCLRAGFSIHATINEP